MKIAIIGAGFFGATAALKLSKYHDVDLFEKKNDIAIAVKTELNDAMIEYVKNQMSMAQNRRAIVGTPNVHHKGSVDMYAKRSAFIHTLRSIVDNESIPNLFNASSAS